jgi:hypothetical protein
VIAMSNAAHLCAIGTDLAGRELHTPPEYSVQILSADFVASLNASYQSE